MKYFKRLFSNLKEFKGLIATTIFFNILIVIFTLASTYILIPVLSIIFGENEKVYVKPEYVVDGLTAFQTGGIGGIKEYLTELFNYYMTQWMDNHGVFVVMTWVCILGAFFFFMKNLCRYVAGLALSYINIGLEQRIRTMVHSKIMKLSLAFFSEQKKGDIISRVTGDVAEVQWSILTTFSKAIYDPLTIIGIMFSLIIMSPQLTLFLLVLFPVTALVIARVGKSLKEPSKKAREEYGQLISMLDEDLGGLKIIKSYTATEMSEERFKQANKKYANELARIARRSGLASPLSEMVGAFVIIALIGYAGSLILNQQGLSASVFIAYIALFYQLIQPSKSIAMAFADIRRGEAAAQRIFEIIDAPITVRDKKDALPKKTFDQAIEFKNVWFKYPDSEDKWIIRDFSLTIPKGKMVALVGPSGSGKTTITNLLCRFYDIERGEILMDGTDIRNLNSRDVRRLESLVTQDSVLFHDTIKNNIKLGSPEATDQQVYQALEVANAKEFIDKLPLGIDTNVRDGGNRLSGGQRQRICIARAVLKNAPILLLDEATSALDTESEKLVQVALENLMKGQTSVVVAHRLSTIQKADIIVVMNDGQIVEQGTHGELIAQDGLYAKLIKMQSFK